MIISQTFKQIGHETGVSESATSASQYLPLLGGSGLTRIRHQYYNGIIV